MEELSKANLLQLEKKWRCWILDLTERSNNYITSKLYHSFCFCLDVLNPKEIGSWLRSFVGSSGVMSNKPNKSSIAKLIVIKTLDKK